MPAVAGAVVPSSGHSQSEARRRSSVRSLQQQGAAMTLRCTSVSKHSIYSVRTGGGGLSSGRNSSVTLQEDDSLGGATVNRPQNQVFRFVYSEAVERAFRRNYHCPTAVFTARSAKPGDPSVEIQGLPEIYSDFVTMCALLESNHRHIEQLRAQMEARGEVIREKSVVKLPRLSFRNTAGRLRQRSQADSMTTEPKLPAQSVGSQRGNSSTEPAVAKTAHSQLDKSVAVGKLATAAGTNTQHTVESVHTLPSVVVEEPTDGPTEDSTSTTVPKLPPLVGTADTSSSTSSLGVPPLSTVLSVDDSTGTASHHMVHEDGTLIAATQ